MSGKAIIIVGMTGTGKTTLVKGRLKNANKNSILLYDVNNEYKEIIGEQKLLKFEDFADRTTKVSNAIIVYEESTIFLSNRGSNDQVRDVLVRKRHTNNTIFFVFHSLRAVPRNIFDLSNFLILLKTNDSEDLVESKFNRPDLTSLFSAIKNHKDKHYHKIYPII